ncbi:MAG: TPM domain-containing protein [Flavobacteriales bacterium]
MSAITAAEFLTEAERTQVAQAISEAESHTAGEIRVHLEDHIEDDVLDHAAFVFEELGMHRTRDRSGVLIYVCVADRKVAVIGDKGINERVPPNFWADVVAQLTLRFTAGQRTDGLREAVLAVGEKLVSFFPRRADDTDELSNEVSFDHR